MKREWKPGDVAMLRCRDGIERTAILTDRGDLSPLWIAESVDCGRLWDDVPVRPLVVIDPEDREQVERLVAAFETQRGESMFSRDDDHMQAALRSLVTPPKPEEPLGLGAVVEDAGGNLVVRIARGQWGWVEANGMLSLSSRCQREQPGIEWAQIAAVRVLSDGWSGDE